MELEGGAIQIRSSPSPQQLSSHFSDTPFRFKSSKMPYPETTDAFAVNDIKNWSTFKRQEVCSTL
jgi:hypothetical protein